jgi:Domain of unknown function (DUF4426)
MVFIQCNNNIINLLRTTLLVIVSFLISIDAYSEQSKTFGDYEVHYVAYNSSFLSGDVAKIYGISRSKKQAVTVISIQHKDTAAVGIQGDVSGGAMNLMQQLRRLDFEEIKEGKAIYYVSTFTFNHEENLTFKVDVTIAPTGKTHQLKWQQQFWRD